MPIKPDAAAHVVGAALLARFKVDKWAVARITSEDGIDMAAYMMRRGGLSRLRESEPSSGDIRIVADINVPPYMIDTSRTTKLRKRNGLRLESIIHDVVWDESYFAHRAATVYYRMVPLKALWDVRTEAYREVVRLREMVGRRQLARMSAIVMLTGRVTTEDFCRMTAADCHYWLGWASGGIAGMEAREIRTRARRLA